MNERPILFSGEMVRAILAGRKTQTRRVMKQQPGELAESPKALADDSWLFHYDAPNKYKCPYGNKGDRLWVRETWAVNKGYDRISPSMAKVAMGGDYYGMVRYLASPDEKGTFPGWVGRWRPSIHMPREFSRLLLDVKRVWVERLQDITEEDAMTEGVEMAGDYWDQSTYYAKNYQKEESSFTNDAVASFRSLWDSINGTPRKGGTDISWAANPWVWCIEFEKVPVDLSTARLG